MTKIGVIGSGSDGASWAQQMVELVKSRNPEYEVIVIDSCQALPDPRTGRGPDVIIIDEAKGFTDSQWDGVVIHEDSDRYPNVGTIGHVDHNARKLQRNSVSGMLSLKASAKLMTRTQGWVEPRERIGKGQRKAGRGDRWATSRRPGQ